MSADQESKQERAAVPAQRFRVYRRHGYYRPGLRADRDAHDTKTPYFLATLPDGADGPFLPGSARLILGESRAGFRFPPEKAFEFELPAVIQETAVPQRVEVSRVVAEAVQGIVRLLTPLGLIQAVSEYAGPRGTRCGLVMIKNRFFRALQGVGLCLHEIKPAQLVYPSDGPAPGYFHKHPDPVIPAYWLADDMGPSIERAIMRDQGAGG
jgi:hypothetical protein